MEIKILYFDGCPNDQPTRALIEQVLTEEGLRGTVEMVPVETPEAAEEHRFLGSPTILVNGVDMEPSRRSETNYALSCRTYSTPEGRSGVPPLEIIRAAIRTKS